jgi:UDP-GlcNAc:undecaprenyl-phosphate GlcNAc-1-phosphate transferase
VTVAWPAVALVAGSLVAGALALLTLAGAPSRLVRPNHTGRPVPAVLGSALVGGVVAGALAGRAGAGLPFGPVEGGALVAVVALAAVGLLDDLFGGQGARGFRGHIGGLLRRRPTTGLLKLLAGVAAGVGMAMLIGGGPVRLASAALLIATAANLWNALDVRPGRSLKWAVVVLVPVFAASRELGVGLVLASALGAGIGVLPFDLLERGMLGDHGSNPLGFLVGTGLAVVLPTAGVLVAAVLALALQVVAETVTISRLIEAVPPLRWFDRLGWRAPA